MNAALYLFNALAMVAVVSFHFFAEAPNAQVHINLQDWVQRPAAQRAGMHERVQAPVLATTAPRMDEQGQLPAPRLDRYTF
ncbi:hypothetical protein [Pseudomonas japonica]|uniref:hypothetical protein n=1 Tax=Pseudomonas japonica TaxID=256466 RepID=UPI0015E28424|nr:hypothetical protein [Pseudomonas japonica]MBA1291594.1 hypothetical protein [Pseudomonas japonica]